MKLKLAKLSFMGLQTQKWCSLVQKQCWVALEQIIKNFLLKLKQMTLPIGVKKV